uniref:Uncharacterized protein n=1 Tax=Arundo donax TaxID=35708 RepID=A0A0A8ZI57_ARUDO
MESTKSHTHTAGRMQRGCRRWPAAVRRLRH